MAFALLSAATGFAGAPTITVTELPYFIAQWFRGLGATASKAHIRNASHVVYTGTPPSKDNKAEIAAARRPAQVARKEPGSPSRSARSYARRNPSSPRASVATPSAADRLSYRRHWGSGIQDACGIGPVTEIHRLFFSFIVFRGVPSILLHTRKNKRSNREKK